MNKINNNLLKPLFREDEKGTLRKLTFKNRLRKQPVISYIIFAVVLLWLNQLAADGIVKSTFVGAISSTLIYCIMAVGFCLLLGYSALASLGTAGFFCLGANIAYLSLVEWDNSILMTFIIAILLAVVVGVVVGYISLRIEGIYLAIVTLGIAQIVVEIFKAVNGDSIKLKREHLTWFNIEYVKGSGIDPRLSTDDVYFMMVAILLVLMIITHNLMNSPTGRAMLAMKNSTSAAQAFGVSLLKYRLLSFIISIVYAVIAGVMFMLSEKFVSHSSTQFALGTSLNILAIVIIGGTKSIWGAIFGTFLIYGIESMFLINIPFFRNNPDFIDLLSGVLVILVVMFYPGGVSQLMLEIKLKVAKVRTKIREAKYGKDLG
jgi:branched-chain amino acid transport system permease protein